MSLALKIIEGNASSIVLKAASVCIKNLSMTLKNSTQDVGPILIKCVAGNESFDAVKRINRNFLILVGACAKLNTRCKFSMEDGKIPSSSSSSEFLNSLAEALVHTCSSLHRLGQRFILLYLQSFFCAYIDRNMGRDEAASATLEGIISVGCANKNSKLTSAVLNAVLEEIGCR